MFSAKQDPRKHKLERGVIEKKDLETATEVLNVFIFFISLTLQS